MTLGTWVQDSQTLIAGAIGFAGVIGTLLLNARYAREQRREQRRHECQTLRVALIEELKINRGTLVSNKNQIKDGGNDLPDEAGYFVPPIQWMTPTGHSPTGSACCHKRR